MTDGVWETGSVGSSRRVRPMRTRWLLVAGWFLAVTPTVQAQIIVLANLTSDEVVFSVKPAEPPAQKKASRPKEQTEGRSESDSSAPSQIPSNNAPLPKAIHLPAGDVAALWVGKGAELQPGAANASETAVSYLVTPGGAYFWLGEQGKRSLHAIDLGEIDPEAYPGVPEITELTVKILVDDDEPTVASRWHHVLKARVDAASRILERTCRVRLKVIAYDTWESPAETTGLKDGLRAFERLVEPGPAQVAIGFTSQYKTLDRDNPHLGIIRRPLGRHILIRERVGRMSEPEKLEVLVHELGHYFGAVHVLHGRSVMRPNLADGRARMKSFRIGFDPINALIMNHYVTELHAGRTPDVFRPAVADRISHLKRILARIASPALASAPSGRPSPTETVPRVRPAPPSKTVRRPQPELDTLSRSVATLLREFRRPPPEMIEGEALVDWYVRRVAVAAQSLPADLAPRAFLIALGIGFDDTDVLRTSAAIGPWLRRIESDNERSVRLPLVRKTALSGRHDWALHFFVSAMLAARFGEKAATVAGYLKELRDANGGTGFDSTDLAANAEGIAWAKRILARQVLLLELVSGEHLPRIHQQGDSREQP